MAIDHDPHNHPISIGISIGFPIPTAALEKLLQLKCSIYTVFQKKTPTHIIGCKLRSSCLILIIFDIQIPHII